MLPVETLRLVLLQLTRDDLDAVNLVSRSFASLIEADSFANRGPLRALQCVKVLSDSTVKIRKNHRRMIIRPLGATGAAWIKHSFVWDASIDASDPRVTRWLIVVAAYMSINRLVLKRRFATEQLQDELLSVVKCRNVHLDIPHNIRLALASKLFLSCDQVHMAADYASRPVDAPVVTPEDLVAFVLAAKHSFIDVRQSDVLLSHTTSTGYDKYIDMGPCHIGDEGAKQLLATLREKVRGATEAIPTFFINVFDTQIDRSELPKLRHLNTVTGQHFVVQSSDPDAITIKCITVLNKD